LRESTPEAWVTTILSIAIGLFDPAKGFLADIPRGDDDDD